MANNLLLGLGVVIMASVLQGSFMVPMAYVKNWKWENSWAVFTVLGMIVFNWVLAFLSIPSLWQIYQAAPAESFMIPAIFGLGWGIGAVTFGLGIAAVGFALGYAIIVGLGMAMGVFIPMAILHPSEVLTSKGITIMIGLAFTLVGVAIFTKAGMRKEKEQVEKTGRITRLSKAAMKTGILICVTAGVLACLPNVGFALSGSIIDMTLDFKTSPNWAGNAVWTILFTAGALANLLYCGYLFRKNKSFKEYRNPPLPKNLLLIALMALLWIGSFILYGVGARIMGDWGTIIGWPVFFAFSITTACVWGLAQGEWANTSSKTRKLMICGISILVLTIFVFAYGSTR